MKDYSELMQKQNDDKLRKFLQNAWKLLLKNPDDENAQAAIEAIKAEWTNRLIGFLNGTYKSDRPEQGIFTTLGYHVGHTQGVSDELRHQLLDYMIMQDLPPAGSPAYLAEWNAPLTQARYKKLHEVLKNLSKKYKNQETHIKAVREWTEDIEYIENKWRDKFS